MGKRDFSYFSTPSGRDGAIVITNEGLKRGCASEAVKVAGLGPLRVILVDGKEAEVSGLSGKARKAVEEVIKDVSKRAIQEIVEERDEAGGSSWYSSCLAKFSRCLGMLTESFEWEILILLKMMKDQKRKLNGRKMKKLETSKFERELRKLKCTMNYFGE